MKEKRNEFWWLDVLEAKFTNAIPRFAFTNKLINAHNNSHLLKKLPETRNDALKQIQVLKSQLFLKKYHGAHKKVNREVSRIFKQQRLRADDYEPIEKLFNDKDFVAGLVSAKLAKLISNAILISKDLKTNPPSYILKDIINIITDRSNPCNSTSFFIKYCQNDKSVNEYVSKLWNVKEMKGLCNEVEWTFRKIRGQLTKEELAHHAKANVSKGRAESKANMQSESNSKGVSACESDDDMANSLCLVAGSDDDDDESDELESRLYLDGITEAEDVIHDPQQRRDEKKRKALDIEMKLPRLASGYFSGASDDEEDVDNDKAVKELVAARKNRRGQRARQKIWEQKYGRKANHIQHENRRVASERERKQKEFEERQRRRELKAQTAAAALNDDKPESMNTNKLHPSWEARKMMEQKQKDVKFTGKKISFD